MTVIQSPSNKLFLSINFNTEGTPPTLCKSSIKNLPLGFKSARYGVDAIIFWKSSILKSTFAAFAIAKKCSTELVEPPKTAINLIAFSIELLVTISLGFKSNSNIFLIAFPIRLHSFFLFSLIAGSEELYGSDIPNASIAEAMVFAVYIPPHAPAPGQALFITHLNWSSDIFPETFSPQASKAETTSNLFPL